MGGFFRFFKSKLTQSLNAILSAYCSASAQPPLSLLPACEGSPALPSAIPCVCGKHLRCSPLALPAGGWTWCLPPCCSRPDISPRLGWLYWAASSRAGRICVLLTGLAGRLVPSVRGTTASSSSQRCCFAAARCWDAAMRAGKCSELLGNTTHQLVQIFLLVWRADSEALYHHQRFLTHFSSVNATKKLGCTTELVLWCFLQAGGQLAWVCWQSGKIPASHLSGVMPAWETPSVPPAWLPAVLPPAPRLEKQQKLCHACLPAAWLLGEHHQLLWPGAAHQALPRLMVLGNKWQKSKDGGGLW